MLELLPSSTVRDTASYDRIDKLLKSVRSIVRTFESYLRSTQNAYVSFTDECKEYCERFQDDCMKSFELSGDLCQDALQIIRFVSELCINLHENAEIVLVDLRRFRRQESEKLFQAFRNHLKSFKDNLKRYLEEVDSVVRKELQRYNDSVEELDESLKELRTLVDPLMFYNTAASKEYSKELQEMYRRATERESSLKSSLAELQNMKRLLQVDLQQTKKAVVSCLKHHMSEIKEVMKQLIENYVWKGVEKREISKHSRAGKYAAELAQLNQLYEEEMRNSLDSHLHGKDSVSHERYFIQRCKQYVKSKTESIHTAGLFYTKLLSFLTSIVRKADELDKNFNRASREPFGVNKIDKYKKDLRKHYGQRISDLFQLMILSIEKPNKIFKKLCKGIISKLDLLQKCIVQHNEVMVDFERQSKSLFEDHKERTKSKNSSSRNEELQLNISQTYADLKRLLSRYDQQLKTVQGQMTAEVAAIASILFKESKKAAEETLAFSKSQLINRIVDSEVLAVIKECDRYSVLYEGFFSSDAEVDFRSKIDTPTYCTSSRILARKEDIHQRLGGFQPSLLCCMAGKHSRKNEFECTLLNKGEFIKGNLLVVTQGVEFESDAGLFSKKLRLMIPKSDILNIEKRQISPLYSNAIVLFTEMGQITLVNFGNPDIVAGLLHNRFERREQAVSQSGDNSSVGPVLQSRASTKKKIRMSERHEASSRLGTSQTIKAVPSQLELHSLIQEWFGHSNFFDAKNFTVKKQQKTEDKVECEYEATIAQLRATVREVKTVKRFQCPPSLSFTFHWKVSFVDNLSIPSLLCNLQVTLELRSKKVLMRAQPVSLQKPNYLLQQFRESVQTMIENFGKFVSRHFNGDCCEIHLDQQNIQEKPEDTELNDSLSMQSNPELELPSKLDAPEQAIRMSDGFMLQKRVSIERGREPTSSQLVSARVPPINVPASLQEIATANQSSKAKPRRKFKKQQWLIAATVLIAAMLMLAAFMF